jgi:hypothetical protein
MMTSVHVRFGVLTVVIMKIQVFWGVLLCQPVNGCSHFEGTTFLQNSVKVFIGQHSMTSQKT